ncbi:hypothetical protein JCM3770_004334 [Rhodotorula araucariae]
MPAPHSPDRAKLVQQIANLQHRLAQIDAASPPASTAQSAESSRASTPSGTSLTGKRARKAAQHAGRDPLPPSLANKPKRHIALLFSYEGWAHSGLAYQPKGVYTPLPTVEGCLLNALEKSRLIEPIEESEGFGCGFERCGRTDAGVSSSAQVINLWVRSDLEDPMNLRGRELDPDSVEAQRHARSRSRSRSRSRANSTSSSSSAASDLSFDLAPRKPPADVEIPYITLLNRHLPPSIRVHAWSPVSASFSSRFSCIWRHYKYFFSTSPSVPLLASSFDFGAAYAALSRGQGAGASHPPHADGWQDRLRAVDWQGLELDVDLMRDAVARLVGEHDFRNFCKVDPPKQLSMHIRTVNSASIDRVEGEGDDMWVLNLRGGAFLYNQVRHIVAVLFLVGARLEPPSIVDALLWTSDRTAATLAAHSRGPDEDALREVMDRKPGYQMADDLPLILWQCGFNSSEFSWRTDNAPRAGDLPPAAATALDRFIDHNGRDRPVVQEGETWRKMFLEMNERYTAYRLKTLVLKHHLASFAFHAPSPSPTPSPSPSRPSPPSAGGGESNQKPPAAKGAKEQRFTPLGAGLHARTTSYTPLLARPRGELPETLNARWAAGRGAQRMRRRAENQDEADRVREVNLRIKADALERARRADDELRRASSGSSSSIDEVVRSVEALGVEEGGAETPVKGES